MAAPAGEPELLKKAAEKAAEAPAPKVTQVEEVEPVSPTISEGRRTSHNNIRNQFDEMDEALSKGLMKPIDVTVYYSGEASHHIHATKLMDELDREYGKKVSVQMQKDNDKRQHMEITVGGRLVLFRIHIFYTFESLTPKSSLIHRISKFYTQISLCLLIEGTFAGQKGP